MQARNPRRASAVIGGAAIVGSLLIAPAAASAAPVVAESESAACVVTDGTLTWGLKESFRSYISGTIANGSWETSDGASYTTPEFSWGEATGEIDSETGTGSVSFAGTVHFTGHDGILDLTLANPTIEFDGGGKASVMIDARSTDMEGEVTVDKQQEWFADVTVPDPLPTAEDSLDIEQAPAILTNSGANAFAGFYQAEDELDPLTFSLAFDSCAAAVETPASEAPAETAPAPETPVAAPEQEIPWMPIIIGGVAILVIGVTAGMLISGRGKGKQGTPPTPEQ